MVAALAPPRTSLVGREQEVTELVRLFATPPTASERLVTLTGVGGCGKTRLAIEVALRLRERFRDGVWLVDLAPVADPRLVPQRVAAALSLRDTSEGSLIPSLHGRTLLLVLDNCEHLVEACASLVDQLLATCADLRVLATSREPLLIPGERQRRLPPLPCPAAGQEATPAELATCPAVQLFVDRASAVAPGFELTSENAGAIAQICTLLDGIPLAIELAAAQARVLAPRQIAGRLDDAMQVLGGANRLAPTRQQTLRASLDWSYELLSPAEQVVFRRLAVLAGTWGLLAAEAVCVEDTVAQAEVLPALTGLVDKSLLVAVEVDGEVRYRLLEPVRQYAARRLAASGELASTQARQAAYCVSLAEHAERELVGPHQVEWLRRVESELDNIRVVLSRAEQTRDAAILLGVAGPLYYFLWLHRHLREGMHWYEIGLAGADRAAPAVRAKGLFGLTLMLSLVGENARAQAIARQAIAAFHELGDSGALALVLTILAQTTLARGDVRRAREFAGDAVRHARAAGARWSLGHALALLGQVLARQGESARALDLQQQALAIFETHGDAWSRAYALAGIASLHAPGSSVARVAALAGVRWSWDKRDLPALASALEYLALYGGPDTAESQVRFCAAADAIRRSVGVPPPPGEREDVARHLAQLRSHLGEPAFRRAWASGEAADPDKLVTEVLPGLQRQPASGRGRGEALTPREREVALLLVSGATDKQIAAALTITEGTAGLHVHRVLTKLGLRSRVQVADRAFEVGLATI